MNSFLNCLTEFHIVSFENDIGNVHDFNFVCRQPEAVHCKSGVMGRGTSVQIVIQPLKSGTEL